MKTGRQHSAIAITLLAAATAVLPCFRAAGNARDFAMRVPCEVNTPNESSLKPLTWQQGTTPLLSLDVTSLGKPVTNLSGSVAVVRFGPSATSTYFVSVTNQTTTGNSYLVQMPTIGTNTASAAWWYTAYFFKSGQLYWTGNGRLTILATTSTENGLTWQNISCFNGASTEQLAAEAALRLAGDAAGSNRVAQAVSAISNRFLRVVESTPGVWVHKLPGEE